MGLPGGIPEEKLPQCWSDDVRMNALFAPFRLKAANPESWDMKMKFWSDMLRLWCRCRGDPVLSAADAKVAFQRKGRTPACIDIVIEEMYRSGDLVPPTKYQQVLHNGPEGWVRWGARLAFKPAAIALVAVSSLLPARQALDSDGLPKASIDSTQKFVLESVLKEQSSALLDSYPPDLERVGTFDEMMSRCGWTATRDSFEMALGWLVENNQAIIKDEVVKLAEAGRRVRALSAAEAARGRLCAARAQLAAGAARAQRELHAAGADARAAAQLGNRVAAKNHLRKKLKASHRLDKITAALENVKHLLQQMRDVDQNLAIVDTYKIAAEALKGNMKDNNMDEDTVHDTMDELKEVMESYSEIEKALGGPLDDDAADLEAELRDLLSGSGDDAGGTSATKRPTPAKASKAPEPEFVYDGEERILAELNELGVEDASPPRPTPRPPAKVPVKEAAEEAWTKVADKPAQESKPSQAWYPPSAEWNNNYAEIRQDERLHPGQTLNIDFSSPPRLYKHEFLVTDHKPAAGVWLFNADSDKLDRLAGDEYCSSESPGKNGSNFQLAPGGERRREPVPDPQREPGEPSSTSNEPALATTKKVSDFEDLERRLKNLRGFNL